MLECQDIIIDHLVTCLDWTCRFCIPLFGYRAAINTQPEWGYGYDWGHVQLCCRLGTQACTVVL